MVPRKKIQTFRGAECDIYWRSYIIIDEGYQWSWTSSKVVVAVLGQARAFLAQLCFIYLYDGVCSSRLGSWCFHPSCWRLKLQIPHRWQPGWPKSSAIVCSLMDDASFTMLASSYCCCSWLMMEVKNEQSLSSSSATASIDTITNVEGSIQLLVSPSNIPRSELNQL